MKNRPLAQSLPPADICNRVHVLSSETLRQQLQPTEKCRPLVVVQQPDDSCWLLGEVESVFRKKTLLIEAEMVNRCSCFSDKAQRGKVTHLKSHS